MQIPRALARLEKRLRPCRPYSSSLPMAATQFHWSACSSSTTAVTWTRSLGTVRKKEGKAFRLLSWSALAP